MTAETKPAHTPGPWFHGISFCPERGPVPFDYQSPGYYDNSGIIGANGQTVVGCGEYSIFNSEADARLIAAAPDMYEALKAIVTEGDYTDQEGMKRIARAALLKAEGNGNG